MEPLRKVQRNRPVSTLSVVPRSDADYMVRSTHSKRPGTLDLTEFIEGTRDKAHGSWKGDFNGRPQLIEDLLPHIRARYASAADGTLKALRASLRAWWRLLDECDKHARVNRALDVGIIHEAIQLRASTPTDLTIPFLRLLNDFREDAGKHPLVWSLASRPSPVGDLPPLDSVRAIYTELKKRAWDAIARTSAIAPHELGRNWADPMFAHVRRRQWRPEDCLATYLGVADRLGNPCPSLDDILDTLGLKNSRGSFTSVHEIASRIYLNADDVRALFHLFIVMTGWNPQVALDLDITSDCVVPHPLYPDLQLIRGTKERGGTEQLAISQTKRELGPGNLLLLLREKTRALREHVYAELAAALRDGEHERARELQALVKSPWLFHWRGGRISCLTMGSYDHAVEGGSFLASVVEDLNTRSGSKNSVVRMTSTQFRDVYVSWAYENSGYNWLIAKLAAGHVDIRAATSYLRNKTLRNHGRKKVRSLTSNLWNEITERRIVEPAILKRLVDHGSISEEQRIRWLGHKDRTRVGAGCRDFRNPPTHIAPEHSAGAGCRIQRCTLCEHSIFFEDSVDLLARRNVELLKLRSKISVPSFSSSGFMDELTSVEMNLSLFDQSIVSERLSYWTKQVASGAHRAAENEGSYD